MKPILLGGRFAGRCMSAAMLLAVLQHPVQAAEEATAPQHSTVVLGSGERAAIVVQSVTNRDYVKNIQPQEGLPPRLVIATIASGLQIAKKADATCVRIQRELVALEDVKTALGTIQAPLIRVDESPTDCP